MVSRDLIERFYLGCQYDGTHLFYSWIRKFTNPETVMLNVGAGCRVGRPISSFKGEVAWVVGADIDPAVTENPALDEAHVCGDRMPFATASFDVAISDYVLEHVEKPLVFMHEVYRVLKPGGAFFFRTPNVLHYVSLVARLTPHRFHKMVANPLRGLKATAHEPYPTYYRLNTRGAIARAASVAGFTGDVLRLVEPAPAYLVFHPVPFLVGVAYERLVNRFERLAPFRANIFGRLVKEGNVLAGGASIAMSGAQALDEVLKGSL
jgi:SAM-dependent methyltransferase